MKDWKEKDKNQLRIEIARDVIERLDNHMLIPIQGRFLSFASIKGRADEREREYVRVDQAAIQKNKCYACAKGSIFVEWVRRYNEFTSTEGGVSWFYNVNASHEHFPEGLLDVFPQSFLDCLEAAFEKQDYPWHTSDVDTKPYVNAFDKHVQPTDRLRAIMQHIIDNNGEFPLPI